MTLARIAAALALPCLWAGPATAQDAGAALSNPVAALPLERLTATRERPLFDASRRVAPPAPPPVVAVRPPPPPPPPPALSLFGIVADADGARAIVRNGSNAITRLRVGDQIDGWAVTEIGSRQLVLALGDRTETFSLFAPGAPNAVAPRTFTAFTVPVPSAKPLPQRLTHAPGAPPPRRPTPSDAGDGL